MLRLTSTITPVLFALAGLGLTACGEEQASPEVIEAGRLAFAPCATCHSASLGAPHSIGPNLYGVVGRQSGTAEGFDYSRAMKSSGIVWNRSMLDAYLEDPRAIVEGTSMIYEGVPEEETRSALIAYLRSLVEE